MAEQNTKDFLNEYINDTAKPEFFKECKDAIKPDTKDIIKTVDDIVASKPKYSFKISVHVLLAIPSSVYGSVEKKEEVLKLCELIIKNKSRIYSSEYNVMLAHVYDPDKHDITGWYLSEKHDGLRGFWFNGKMMSRTYKEFKVPAWFVEDFPDEILDGELHCGAGTFNKTGCIRKKVPVDSEWREQNVRYAVFDIPNMLAPFSERLKRLKEITKHCKYIDVVEQIKCEDTDQLAEMLDGILKNGGEGVMARDPKSASENKRSNKLLKVKTFQDAEAEIIGYEEGTGRLEGMVGAIQCRMTKENGKVIEFKVGTGLSDDIRDYKKVPKIGTIITVKFYDFSSKDADARPRHPVFLRVREEE
jgi:DNA ligase 1